MAGVVSCMKIWSESTELTSDVILPFFITQTPSNITVSSPGPFVKGDLSVETECLSTSDLNDGNKMTEFATRCRSDMTNVNT